MESIATYQKVMADHLLNKKPEVLMVMLYDRMIAKLKQASEQHHVGQVIHFKESTLKAMGIVSALMENLNMEQGGEVAQNLERLYGFIISQLSQATFSQDPQPLLNDVLNILITLHQSWQKLAEKN